MGHGKELESRVNISWLTEEETGMPWFPVFIRDVTWSPDLTFQNVGKQHLGH